MRQADTQVKAYLNGDEIYSHYGGGDKKKTFDDRVDIKLQSGYNVLLVLGVRWMANYLYDVEVQLNGRQITKYESTGARTGTDNGIVWDFSLELNLVD